MMIDTFIEAIDKAPFFLQIAAGVFVGKAGVEIISGLLKIALAVWVEKDKI